MSRRLAGKARAPAAHGRRSDPKRRKGFASKQAWPGGNFGGNCREPLAHLT